MVKIQSVSCTEKFSLEHYFGIFDKNLQVEAIVDQYLDCDLCLMRIDVLLNQSVERISYYRIELNRHTDYLLSAQYDIPKILYEVKMHQN